MAAALLALVLLSFASVQSTVMQAAMSPPGDMGRICGGDGAADAPKMAGMAMGQSTAAGSRDHHHGASRGQKTCPFCAAAAHPPIIGQATPLRLATSFTYAVYRVGAGHGSLGPLAFPPRARGPPLYP